MAPSVAQFVIATTKFIEINVVPVVGGCIDFLVDYGVYNFLSIFQGFYSYFKNFIKKINSTFLDLVVNQEPTLVELLNFHTSKYTFFRV